eukprot:CAMPEP_0182865278 /NCGR_PEP_ID=MMETSP0034_2-20130328/7607_1 /TAXON_ID=156128 /ORGANISM="Nephroselmis pyriformis, Strain CCMP717" /LENGTH=327 /DNA_ID=CAMNT_0024997573 /DNA_START=79 /DNA_END=1058 /DNA_ORIENTATION=+
MPGMKNPLASKASASASKVSKKQAKLARAVKHQDTAIVTPTTEKGFIKALGTFDKATRDKALEALTKWLSKRKGITEPDLAKLWKGLFFCFWHSDKAGPQEDLATRLAAVMVKLPQEVMVAYFQVFLTTMRREWHKIDHLRMDKFMMMTRKFFQQTVVILEKTGWDEERVALFAESIGDRVLDKDDPHAGLGFALHVADIYLEALVGAKEPLPAGTVDLLLEPWYGLLEAPVNKALMLRVETTVWGALADHVKEGTSAFSQMDVSQVVGRLVETAGEETTPSANRAVLHSASKAIRRAEHARERAAAGGDGEGGSSARKRAKMAAAR